MTNEQRIAKVAVEYGIITELEAVEMLDNGEGDKIPLHTATMWERIGKEKGLHYKIRKGENGIPCNLWKRRKKTSSSGSEFYLAKCYLFKENQIETVTDTREDI